MVAWAKIDFSVDKENQKGRHMDDLQKKKIEKSRRKD